MKYAAFDLEIAKAIPDDVSDIKQFFPLGISCAALAFSDQDEVKFWQGAPHLSRDECQNIVSDLQKVISEGYTLLTWNGCNFDFHVLAYESSLFDKCGKLALNHIDLMLTVTFTKGYFLGLDKALAGAGISGKAKKVTLSNGTLLTEMSGAKAPQLWADGEYQAVLEYLRADVNQLIELAKVIESKKSIQWKSNKGRIQSFPIDKFLTVKECFNNIPQPDVSWMDSPPSRTQFVEWIPNWNQTIFKTVRFKSTNIEPYPMVVQDVSLHHREIEPLFGFIDDDTGANEDSFFANLILENGNAKDSNAVRVEIENYHIGYLSPTAAKKYRKKIEDLGISGATGVCHASIRGGYRKGNRIDFSARLDINIDNLEVDTDINTVSKPIHQPENLQEIAQVPPESLEVIKPASVPMPTTPQSVKPQQPIQPPATKLVTQKPKRNYKFPFIPMKGSGVFYYLIVFPIIFIINAYIFIFVGLWFAVVALWDVFTKK